MDLGISLGECVILKKIEVKDPGGVDLRLGLVTTLLRHTVLVRVKMQGSK